MSSHRVLKKDENAKRLLLSQIESFANQNGIDIDQLYDVDHIEAIFIPDLKRLEHRLAECDDLIQRMFELDTQSWRINLELEDLCYAHKLGTKHRTICITEFYYDFYHPMHHVAAQRRAYYARRVWEIRTLIEACHRRRTLSRLSDKVAH